MKYMRYLLLSLLLLNTAQAEETPERPKVSPGNVPGEEVVIRAEGDITVYEYREHGQVYKVKIVPKKGRPYFLVDSDGNGTLDRVEWILLRW